MSSSSTSCDEHIEGYMAIKRADFKHIDIQTNYLKSWMRFLITLCPWIVLLTDEEVVLVKLDLRVQKTNPWPTKSIVEKTFWLNLNFERGYKIHQHEKKCVDNIMSLNEKLFLTLSFEILMKGIYFFSCAGYLSLGNKLTDIIPWNTGFKVS